MKHTPGPWRVTGHTVGRAVVVKVESKDQVICDAIGNARNAWLLAAAPELLESLEDLDRSAAAVAAAWEGGDLATAVRDLLANIANAKVAIAKAKGPL